MGGINNHVSSIYKFLCPQEYLNTADSYQKSCGLSNVFNLWPFREAMRALLREVSFKLGLASWAIPAYTSGLSPEHCGTVSLVCIISHLGKVGWQVPIWGPYV